MSVRCKFRVSSITYETRQNPVKNPDCSWAMDEKNKFIYVDGRVATVRMVPVYNDAPENKLFWEATPAGTFEMQCVNEAAVAQLIVGDEYYIDITKAPKS